MSIVLNFRPIKSGCNYNALGNPVVYGLIRKDHIVNQVNNPGGGNIQLQINGVDHTTYYQVGNSVYFESTAGVYDGVWEITASAFSSGNTLITLTGSVGYSHATGGYVNNLSKRTDYAMSIQVLNEDSDPIGPPLEFVPDTTGRVEVDVSSIIKTRLRYNWSLPVADEEMPTTFKFKISTAEYYDDAYTSYTDDTEWIVGVFAALQLFNDMLTLDFNSDGGNMLAYIPDNTNAKWLTKFNQPSLWRGYPFTVSFLWPSSIAGLKKRIVQKSAAGVTLSTNDIAITASSDVMMRIALGVAVNAAASTIEITLLDASDDSPVSSTLTVKVKEPCLNPVHLVWNNSLGGDSYWQFSYNQELEVAINNSGKGTSLLLYADRLLLDEWKALNELIVPDDVYAMTITNLTMNNTNILTHYRDSQQVFMVNGDGSVKMGVVSTSSNARMSTRSYTQLFELEVQLPQTFTL